MKYLVKRLMRLLRLLKKLCDYLKVVAWEGYYLPGLQGHFFLSDYCDYLKVIKLKNKHMPRNRENASKNMLFFRLKFINC
jgi:hypothetical protein